MKNLINSLGLVIAAVLISSLAVANDLEAGLVGHWRSAGVKCVGPSGTQDPNYTVRVDLDMKADKSYSAVGSVAGFSCTLTGTYSENGSKVTFKLGNSGCPISSYIGNSFVASVKGNKMSASFGTKIGEKICTDTKSRVVAYMIK